jgi:SAM-dependent methyltransferase
VLTPDEWHSRYQQQAAWTKDLRSHLYRRSGLEGAARILDVGCGTGVLLPELREGSQAAICGLDIEAAVLKVAARQAPGARLLQGDALNLPFLSSTFDLTLCHFLLLWVSDPTKVASEMARVTRPGGAVLVLAEPDYGGRIDYPPEFEEIAGWQTASLIQQGADPKMGRQLAGILHKVGLVDIESGVLGAHWQGPPSTQDQELEWEILLHDIKKISGADFAPEGLEDKFRLLKEREASAWHNGERVLYVPTFFAWGRVP